MKKNVYIVTSGSYSSYRIVAVFSDRKAANQFCDRYRATESYEQPRVEDHALFGSVADAPVCAELYYAWAELDKEGAVKKQGGHWSREWVTPPITTRPYRISGRTNNLRVMGPTVETTVKVLHDWIAEVRAMRQGIV